MKTRIKYDKRTQKICRCIMIASGVLLLVGLLLLALEDVLQNMVSGTLELLLVFVLLAAYASVPVLPLSLILYIDIVVYFRRLENNHFKIPEKKKDYDDDLSRLPRTEAVENRYAKDSMIAAVIMLALYAVFLVCDVLYLVRWIGYGMSDAKVMFVLLLGVHLIFPGAAYVLYREKDTEKYVDDVDIRDARKVRCNVINAVGAGILLSLVAAFSLTTAHSMTKYIYRSRNGGYDEDLSDFQQGATLSVRSDDLYNGVWDAKITNTAEGENLSPHLYFDPVEGADHYVIYMVDETSNNWVHWLATDMHENELFSGDNLTEYGSDPHFAYIGPYPPAGSGEHIYTVYVYALKKEPDCDLSLVQFDDRSFGADLLYYDFLNVSQQGDPDRYGNVLAYGYVSGVYER